MVEKMFTTEAAAKLLKWIFGKDSTAIATWAMLGAGAWGGWYVYQNGYLPEQERSRQQALRVWEKLDASVAKIQSIADTQDAACDRDKERLYKANEALMNRVDRMLEQQRFGIRPMTDLGVAASPPEFDCDP